MAKSSKALRFKIILLLASLLFALGVAEIVLRFTAPRQPMLQGFELKDWRKYSDEFKKVFQPDPDLGFRPKLGTDWYDQHGINIKHGGYSAKAPEQRRVLFIGDSVTARRAIDKGMLKVFGSDNLQYLNAGVESYNTHQESLWYERFNRQAQPDHVILTLHMNDFDVTPVAFYDANGDMAMVAPDKSALGINAWAFQHIYIYRSYFTWRIQKHVQYDVKEGEEVMRQALQKLQQLCQQDGTNFTVLVLPVCRPLDQWKAQQKDRRLRALKLLTDLGIHHFDLLPPMQEAIAAGVEVQETKGDDWHPSVALGEGFARYLEGQGFKP